MKIRVSDSTNNDNNDINNNTNDINNTNNLVSKNSIARNLDYHSLETVKELDSEKTFSHSIDSSYCSTPSSSCDLGAKRLLVLLISLVLLLMSLLSLFVESETLIFIFILFFILLSIFGNV